MMGFKAGMILYKYKRNDIKFRFIFQNFIDIISLMVGSRYFATY